MYLLDISKVIPALCQIKLQAVTAWQKKMSLWHVVCLKY